MSTPHDMVQSILLADRIHRCELIDTKLHSVEPATHEELCRQIGAYHRLMMEWLFDRCDESDNGRSGPLSPRDVVLWSCLILQDLHFRDVLSCHFESAMSPAVSSLSVTDCSHGGGARRFGLTWDLMLQHRFDDSATVGYECHVEMNGLKVPYGFHYMSPHVDNVVTPGSLRTLFSVFGSVRSAQGMLLVGPSGTSKTHLAFQVSRLLGRQYFSTTANAPTIVAHVLMLLRGALHAGGTFCLSIAPSLSDRVLEIVRVVAATLENVEVRDKLRLPSFYCVVLTPQWHASSFNSTRS